MNSAEKIIEMPATTKVIACGKCARELVVSERK